eukprot:TRINITY_DN3843_c0_g2_i6.p1 TRINITY_DN3843_c0_g2~~TRINITY_DN3843_c0_g2_i6.p1  ORF type:complete len:542 (+),score=65.46 TRINITY_DN3843_c0_g2_i6:111-1736(+)
MQYLPLFVVVAVMYGLLAIATLIRLVSKFRNEQIAFMDKRDISSLIIFFALFAYSLCRCLSTILVLGGVTSGNVDNYEQNLLGSIPAGMFLMLQTAMLHKWSLHVKEMTHILRNDRFRLGGTLLTSSIGLLIACVILPLGAVIDHFTDTTPAFSPREWNFLLQLFFGITYIFNGAAFMFLGVYLRFLWTPEGAEAIAASRRILAIALIFGTMCITRGCVLLGYLRVRLLSNKDFSKQSVSKWGEPVLYIVEWTLVTISLAVLTISMSKQRNGSTAPNSAGGHGNNKHLINQSLTSHDLESGGNNSGRSLEGSTNNRGGGGKHTNNKGSVAIAPSPPPQQQSFLHKSKKVFSSIVGVLADTPPDGESTIYDDSSSRLSTASGARRTVSSDSFGSLPSNGGSVRNSHSQKQKNKRPKNPGSSSRRSMDAYATEKQPILASSITGSPSSSVHGGSLISSQRRGIAGSSSRGGPRAIQYNRQHNSSSMGTAAGSPASSHPTSIITTPQKVPLPPAVPPPTFPHHQQNTNNNNSTSSTGPIVVVRE